MNRSIALLFAAFLLTGTAVASSSAVLPMRLVRASHERQPSLENCKCTPGRPQTRATTPFSSFTRCGVTLDEATGSGVVQMKPLSAERRTGTETESNWSSGVGGEAGVCG